MKPLTVWAAACLVSLTSCAAQPPETEGPSDFHRGLARGYERALDDVRDCAEESADVEDFTACVGSKAVFMASFFLDETDTRLDRRRRDAESSALQTYGYIKFR